MRMESVIVIYLAPIKLQLLLFLTQNFKGIKLDSFYVLNSAFIDDTTMNTMSRSWENWQDQEQNCIY